MGQFKAKVYIAAPYTSNPAHNLNRVIGVADLLLKKGYIPYVPHLSLLWDTISPHKYNDWLKYDNEWLPYCNYIVRLSGKSNGADREVKFAKNLGIKLVKLSQLLN